MDPTQAALIANILQHGGGLTAQPNPNLIPQGGLATPPSLPPGQQQPMMQGLMGQPAPQQPPIA